MVSETLEIRWFLPEMDTAEMFAIFRKVSGREPNTETPRTDWYLRLPHCQNIGVKIREGRIEHKWLLHRMPGKPACASSYGLWRKSSLELQSSDGDKHADDWIPVKKQRWFSSWTWRRDRAEPVSRRDERRETRCDLEAARLDLVAPCGNDQKGRESSHAWSLCFESEGPHRTELQNAVIARFCEAGFASLLEKATAMDYPQWLRRINSPESGRSE